MAKAIRARHKGDEYQELFFWIQALEMSTSDVVESVVIESEQLLFMDDVVMKYHENMKIDRGTGDKVNYDYFQCKYHVTEGGSFKVENLIDPKFINTKESMLQRLYKAYKELDTMNSSKFRLYIVSNWHWHPDDIIAKHIAEEALRPTFFNGGSRSRNGKVRDIFKDHLKISDDNDLKGFLSKLRFNLGKNICDLTNELRRLVQIAGLQPLNEGKSENVYRDLARQFIDQGRTEFNEESFNKMLRDEGLFLPQSSEHSEISIKSFAQFAKRPDNILSEQLDITDLFNFRFAKNISYWNKEIPQKINTFVYSKKIKKLKQPIYLFFDCHISIAFLLGHILDPKYRMQLIPTQFSRRGDLETWNTENFNSNDKELWSIEKFGEIQSEVVVSISITNPITAQLNQYLESSGKANLPKLFLSPANGIGPTSISDGYQAWQMGYELQTILRTEIPPSCETIHFFYSGPAALAYIIGNTTRHITKYVQLYEYDFEGTKYKDRYYKSIMLPVKNLNTAGE